MSYLKHITDIKYDQKIEETNNNLSLYITNLLKNVLLFIIWLY